MLDRQAAITHAEINHDAGIAAHEAGKILRKQIDELQEQVDNFCASEEVRNRLIAELTASAKRWADAANEQRLVAIEQADKVQELTAERDEWRAKAEQATNQPTSQSDALKTEETTENGATKSEMRDFDDSREKLEADVRKRYTYTVSTAMWPPSANKHTDMVSAPIDTVLGWLDRQVAITRAEVFGDGEFDCMTCDAKRELQECVEDLSGACELLNGVNEKLREQVDERARRAATRRRRT